MILKRRNRLNEELVAPPSHRVGKVVLVSVGEVGLKGGQKDCLPPE